jgi:hypothetical protein
VGESLKFLVGKTTLTLHIVAQAQKEGGIAAFIDAEHALDPFVKNYCFFATIHAKFVIIQ